MLEFSDHQHAFKSSHEMNIRFQRSAPPWPESLKATLSALERLPGCVSYVLAHQPFHLYPWSIRGIWNDDEARNLHYQGAELQLLLEQLIHNGAWAISFSQT
jgi:quinol monooxygenase YgiN